MRPAGRFHGVDPEPRPGLPSGHMPTAMSLPFMEIVHPSDKTLLPKAKLLELFACKGIDVNKPIITTCGSGITAAMLYFALEYVGAKQIAVYDGSWAEYGSLSCSQICKS